MNIPKTYKTKLPAILLVLMMLTITTFSSAAGTITNSSEPAKTEKVRAEALISRIHEIASLNKKELSKDERGQLKKEAKSIKRELKELGGGVYISATLLVIIIILIILL